MAEVGEPVIVRVIEEYHIAQARQAARGLGEALGLSQAAIFCLTTAVSELANNLFFHSSRGGTIALIAVGRCDAIGVEVTAEDDGPGIPDVNQAMQDGYSTNGGLGGGLPGVERLMDEFELRSTVGVGTRIITRKWQRCR